MAKAKSTKKGNSPETLAADSLSVLAFDGQDDYVDFGAKPQFKVPKHITLECWVYIETQKQWAGIISKVFDTGSTESGYGLLLDGSSGIYFGVKVPSQGIQYLSSGANSVPLKEWHHIAGAYDGQNLRVYIDGVEKAVQALGDSSIRHDPDNNLRFGIYQDNDETYAFQGKIAEVRLWEVARTQADLQQYMNSRLTGTEPGLVGYWPLNEGSGTTVQDKTANGNQGAIAGATWQQAQLSLGEAMQPSVPEWEEPTPSVALAFDGLDDYIEIKEPFKNNTEFTLSLWLKPAALNTGWRGIIGKEGDATAYRKPSFWLSPGSNGLHYDSVSPAGYGDRYSGTLEAFFEATNQWVHVAWVKQGKEYRFYRNGELFATKPAPEVFYTNESSYWIGRVDNFFPGEITNVQFWNLARTQTDIQSDLRRRLTGAQSGLVEYWPLVEGSGTTANDYTISANHGTINGASWVESQLPILKHLEAAGSAIAATPFSIHPNLTAPSSRIKTLRVSGGWGLDRIQVQYEHLTPTPTEVYDSPEYGRQGGTPGEFSLEIGDYLTVVSGEWGTGAPGYPREEIVSLQFQTYQGKQSQVFGGGNSQKQVEPFSFLAPDGYEIVGFFGACHSTQGNLVRIGVYLHPIHQDSRATALPVQPTVSIPNNSKIKLKSWKGDYLHRPDSAEGVTTWSTGIGNEWTVEAIANNQIKLKSWKEDYLQRPDSQQGIATGTGIGSEWTVEAIADNKVKLLSWKGDYLHRPDSPQGVTTWDTGVGNEWTFEFVEATPISSATLDVPVEPEPPAVPAPAAPAVTQSSKSLLSFGANHQGIAVGGGALKPKTCFTIEAWVYPQVETGLQVIYAEGQSRLYLEGGELKFRVNSTVDPIASVNAEIKAGNWYHVAIVREGNRPGATKLYINGIQNDNQLAVPAIAALGDIYLGIHPDLPDSQWQGKLLEVRVWRYDRSHAEILSNMTHYLTGRELGLMRCWRMNEGLGTMVGDKTSNRAVGAITEGMTWEESEIPIKVKLDPQERLTRSTGLEDYGYWYKEMAKQQTTEAQPPFRRGRIWR